MEAHLGYRKPTDVWDEATAEALGLNEIRNALVHRTRTEMGEALARSQSPAVDVEVALQWRDETTEMRTCLARDGGIPLGPVKPVEAYLQRAAKRAALPVEGLLAVASLLRCSWQIQRYLEHHRAECPLLSVHGAEIPALQFLFEELYGALDPEDGIRDDASEVLSALRAKQRGMQKRIRGKIESMRASGRIQQHLQDDYVTIRDERFVLPVQSGHKVDVPGIIHGSSQTGQTLYVEPQEVVQLNNELKILAKDISEEEHRILLVLTSAVESEQESVRVSARKLAALDWICARAQLAEDLDAQPTTLTASRQVRLVNARNPHLSLRGVSVVPNDIGLEANVRCLVVSGPNAGGKTVTLNTLGVCCAMAALGCHLPVDADSIVPILPRIHAVMGDHQSLADDLSTFSGHLHRIINVLSALPPDRPALVLVDEIAVGTEAMQGAALAVAILEAFTERGAMIVVTTHYERLKLLAQADERYRNAAVGLDPDTKAPTFSLVMGDVGASSPLSIARRLGLEESIIARADALCGGQALGLEAALEAAQHSRAALENERLDTAETKKALEEERKHLAVVRRRLEDEGQRLVLAAHNEAIEAARAAQTEIARVVHQLQQNPDSKAANKHRVSVREIENQLTEQAEVARANLMTAAKDPGPPAHIQTGMAVRVLSMNADGIVESVHGKKITVDLGGLRTTVARSDIRARTLPNPEGETGHFNARRPHSVAASSIRDEDELPPRTTGNTVDLRGLHVEDAIVQVERFLDQGVLRGWTVAFLLHGHGTGKLKAGLRAWLPTSQYVEKFEAAKRSHGGDGVTVVWIQ